MHYHGVHGNARRTRVSNSETHSISADHKELDRRVVATPQALALQTTARLCTAPDRRRRPALREALPHDRTRFLRATCRELKGDPVPKSLERSRTPRCRCCNAE